MKAQSDRYIRIFSGLSLGAIVVAFTYITTLHLSLPNTDLAAGSSLLDLFDDPFVRVIATTGILGTVIVLFPISLVLVPQANINRTIIIVMISVLLEVVVVTPIHPGMGLIGAYVAFIGSLWMCKKSTFIKSKEVI